MKHYLLLIIISNLLLFPSKIYSQSASDYFLPQTIGNYLNLHTVDIPQSSTWEPRTTRFYVDRSDMIFGKSYYRQIGVEIPDNNQSDTSAFQVVWLRQDSVGNIAAGAVIIEGNSRELDSAYIINPPYAWFPNEFLTAGYSRYVGGRSGKDTVISTTESVVVPAGSWSNCIEVCAMNLDSTGKITLRDYAWYARGIGIVMGMRDIPVNQTHTDVLMTFRTVVSVKDANPLLTLNRYTLGQNYPNPFNPTTTINYSVAKEGNVRISVYDITGRKATTIVNENKRAGSYSVKFDGANLSSGIYMYRMEAGSYSEARKFILMK